MISQGSRSTAISVSAWRSGRRRWTCAFRTFSPEIPTPSCCISVAGLDTRIFRVDPPPGVDWFDVDYPEVIELRRKLYPSRDHYHLVASSVTQPDWLAEVPRNRPAIVVAEGLTPYLPAHEGHACLRGLSRILPVAN
ncbi:class I SAM-dependent methyltransferase [Mesorhizobium calcicola]|uniref:Class I SAM-dependent methyltransferase n=1 Tax=Mesorhizobium calcicola TaxID=1300310 RepID=A0ABW4WG89_9HYPH